MEKGNLKVLGNGLELFASQHLDLATTLEVRAAHLQPRYLQRQIGRRVGSGDGQIVGRTRLFLQLTNATQAENMTAIEA
jgi:hypothetical protein